MKKTRMEDILPEYEGACSPRVEAYARKDPDELIIDLKNKRFLPAREIGYLIGVYKRLDQHGGEVKLVNVSRPVEKVLNILNLQDKLIYNQEVR